MHVFRWKYGINRKSIAKLFFHCFFLFLLCVFSMFMLALWWIKIFKRRMNTLCTSMYCSYKIGAHNEVALSDRVKNCFSFSLDANFLGFHDDQLAGCNCHLWRHYQCVAELIRGDNHRPSCSPINSHRICSQQSLGSWHPPDNGAAAALDAASASDEEMPVFGSQF